MSCFFLLSLLSNSSIGRGKIVDKSFVDSIFSSFTKKERLSKLMILPISDFNNANDLKIAERIIGNQGLGGIILQNGERLKVKKWVALFRRKHLWTRPFVALKFDSLLEAPFNGMGDFPPKSQIELLSNDALLMDLGYLMGSRIRDVGVDMIVIDANARNLYFLKTNYLKGIKASGVTIAFRVVDQIDQSVRLMLKEGESTLSIVESESQTTPAQIVERVVQGADMLLLPNDIQKAVSLYDFIHDVKPPKKKTLKARHVNVIHFKRELGRLNKRPFLKKKIDAESVFHKTLLGSVALVRNEKEIFPIRNLDQFNFSSLSTNDQSDQIFRNYLDKYAQMAHYDFEYFLADQERGVRVLNHFDIVFAKISLDDLNDSEVLIERLERVNEKSEVVVIYTGDKINLRKLDNFSTVLYAPENTINFSKLIPQNIFGAREISGRTLGFTSQDSGELIDHFISSVGRLSYGITENNEIDQDRLIEIDIVVRDAIQLESFPGCQVFMAKNGKVIYNKSFGYLTYDSLMAVEDQTIYDIASITKVVATVPSLMFLDEWNKVSLSDSISLHISDYKGTDKAGLKIQDLLAHQSGLKSYYPFWRNAEEDPDGDDFRLKLPSRRRSKYKTLAVNWEDSIQNWIISSKFNSLREDEGGYGYLYSDLGFMSLKNLTESKLNQSFDVFLDQNLYGPLGMNSTGFTPLCRWPIDIIAPTEEDFYLRNRLVWGKVHDRNAALLNGVSGHAGLFSNASDLGKYMQMHLQDGYYGGRNYFSKETIQKFTSRPEGSERRALGWDRPDVIVGNASKYASKKAFGHSGFTGTIVWADPEYELVYVFLSNRVYPDAGNNKLIQSNIRTRIHDIMYESFLNSKN